MRTPEARPLADIAGALVRHIPASGPSPSPPETFPCDAPLLDSGILDSVGVVEFIAFAESTWDVVLSDEDITKERMGSVHKMAALVHALLARAR